MYASASVPGTATVDEIESIPATLGGWALDNERVRFFRTRRDMFQLINW